MRGEDAVAGFVADGQERAREALEPLLRIQVGREREGELAHTDPRVRAAARGDVEIEIGRRLGEKAADEGLYGEPGREYRGMGESPEPEPEP